MPWNRRFLGGVLDDGVVHFLYEWTKDWDRVHWDTQCGIEWEGRENRNRALKPRMTKKPVTCLACIVYQYVRVGSAPWSEQTSASRSAR